MELRALMPQHHYLYPIMMAHITVSLYGNSQIFCVVDRWGFGKPY